MTIRTLFFTAIAAFALSTSANTIKNLDDVSNQLKIDSVVKTYEGPQISDILTPQKTPSRLLRHRQNWSVTTSQCLDPLDRPIVEDCSQVCADLDTLEGGIYLQPFQIWSHTSGHCVLGLANLDPCEILNIDPANTIKPLCEDMLSRCVVNGYDAYVETMHPRLALAMSGLEAAPPYTREACGNE